MVSAATPGSRSRSAAITASSISTHAAPRVVGLPSSSAMVCSLRTTNPGSFTFCGHQISPVSGDSRSMTTDVQPERAPRTSGVPLRRRVARLAERVTTPLLPADYLDLFGPLRAGADLRGRIVSVEPETADAATLVIRP